VGALSAILLRPGSDDWAANGRRHAFIVLVLLVVSAGLRLLVRQWTWGEWAAWAVPLLVTVGTSTFLTTGSLLYAPYADSLGLSPDDISVPAIWQLAATLKLLELLSIVSALPAVWGYARHFHYARDSGRGLQRPPVRPAPDRAARRKRRPRPELRRIRG
jgi:hypothetical protein